MTRKNIKWALEGKRISFDSGFFIMDYVEFVEGVVVVYTHFPECGYRNFVVMRRENAEKLAKDGEVVLSDDINYSISEPTKI